MTNHKQLTIKNMSLEDLKWEWDRAIETGNKRRENAIMNELNRRQETRII